jgi:hypothetical protein
LDLDEDSGGLRRTGVDRFDSRIRGWSQLWNKITFIPQLKGHVLTPKFGKESDMWVRFEKKSPSGGRKDIFRDFRQRDLRSAICSGSAKEQ